MTKFAMGGPAVSKKLIGRKAELEYLLERMKSKSVNYNVAVLGYRRIGKTSILMKLKEILEKEKQYAIVYFDVQKNMAEPKIFFTKLQKTIFDVYVEKLSATEKSLQIGKFFTNIVSAIQSKKITNIGAEVRPDGTIFPKFELGDKSDYGELFLSIFKTIKIFSEKSNIKFIVILDEFQDFRELDRYPGLKQIFDLFRACVQERGENVSYIISGSKIHLLNNILTNGDSPLFAHFEQCMVNEMEEKYARDFFKKYLKARKIKQTVNLDKKAYELVGGQPFYLMALAEAWNPKDDIKKSVYENSHYTTRFTKKLCRLYTNR